MLERGFGPVFVFRNPCPRGTRKRLVAKNGSVRFTCLAPTAAQACRCGCPGAAPSRRIQRGAKVGKGTESGQLPSRRAEWRSGSPIASERRRRVEGEERRCFHRRLALEAESRYVIPLCLRRFVLSQTHQLGWAIARSTDRIRRACPLSIGGVVSLSPQRPDGVDGAGQRRRDAGRSGARQSWRATGRVRSLHCRCPGHSGGTDQLPVRREHESRRATRCPTSFPAAAQRRHVLHRDPDAVGIHVKRLGEQLRTRGFEGPVVTRTAAVGSRR